MRTNHWSWLIRTPLALSFFLAATCPTSKAADPCSLSALPQELQSKLATDYPDWQPETLENLLKDDRALWPKEHPNSCPGIAIGHFESKTYLSYAFFLISKPDKKHFGFHVVVFSRTEESSVIVSHVIFKSARGDFSQGSDLAIARAPPRQYEQFDDDSDAPRKVTIDLDGIFYEAIAQASTLFYWDRGQYKRLPLSD